MIQGIKETFMKNRDNKNILETEAEESQKRLLEAAEELFAQKGFDGTTIRDITTKAERNQAAVNYFFGNKQELYEEIFRRRLREMRDTRLASIKTVMTSKTKPSLEKLIHSYAVAFLEPFADHERSQRFMQLFARELVERRLPKSMFIEEMATPVMAAFEEALAVICPGLNKHDSQRCIHSIVGQLVHIMHIRMMFESGQAGSIAEFAGDKAIEHIVKFSAAGIRALLKGT
jgi:AcrR family transcriptional regulator